MVTAGEVAKRRISFEDKEGQWLATHGPCRCCRLVACNRKIRIKLESATAVELALMRCGSNVWCLLLFENAMSSVMKTLAAPLNHEAENTNSREKVLAELGHMC